MTHHYELGYWFSLKHKPLGTLTFDFSAPQTIENKFMLFRNYPVIYIFIAVLKLFMLLFLKNEKVKVQAGVFS